MNDIEKLSLFQVAEVELVYRNPVPHSDRIHVPSSSMAYEIFMETWDMDKIELLEQVMMILLDASKNCLGVSLIATGGITGCIADPRVIYPTLLKGRATSFVLGHNHPSGICKPSTADQRLTEMLNEGSKILQLRFDDHLIVCKSGYFSMRDMGMMPW